MRERLSTPDRRSPCKNRSISDRVSDPDRRSPADLRSLQNRLLVLVFPVTTSSLDVDFLSARQRLSRLNRPFPYKNCSSSGRSRGLCRRSRPDRRALLLLLFLLLVERAKV